MTNFLSTDLKYVYNQSVAKTVLDDFTTLGKLTIGPPIVISIYILMLLSFPLGLILIAFDKLLGTLRIDYICGKFVKLFVK